MRRQEDLTGNARRAQKINARLDRLLLRAFQLTVLIIKKSTMTKERYNQLATQIVDACFQVHKELGPGLIESVYEYALLKEFELRNIFAFNQVAVKLFYKGYDTGKYYAVDMMIEDEIIIEIKCCEILHPVYIAQLIAYLKLADKKLGFLVNFHVPLIKDGIKRYVNGF